ncbi:MAG: type II toxin-antitoxin system RelE/ParE family toxin [Planctomycetaceae bacterium]|nr:type II toxin-antitoxin system RelE/ParE family toxin [Planctomycetaceae bacterium]
MSQVILSTKLKRQIRETAESIEKDSPQIARRVIRKIIASVRRLKSFPELGAVTSEFRNQRIRELLVFQYRIFYRFDEATQTV